MLEGTGVSLDQLVALQATAQRAGPESFARLIGARESRLAGSGLQMRELRAYQPGDDLRHIHWRATARLGEPLTRVFDQENELSWVLVLMLTPDMFFGSRMAYKSVRALEAAALLGWSRLAAGDAVGSLVLSPQGQPVHRPARTRNGWLQQLATWVDHSDPANAHQALAPSAFATVQAELHRLAAPGRPLVVFADLLPPLDWAGLLQGLSHAAVTLVQLHDPLESDIPAGGTYPVRGPAGPFWLQGSRRARQRHQQARTDWFRSLEQAVARQRLHWVRLGTTEDPQDPHWHYGRDWQPPEAGAESAHTVWEP